MSKNPLTAAERSKILNLRRNGVSYANIAQELHRGKRTIVQFLKNPDGFKTTVKTAEYKELKVTPKKENKTFIRVDYQKPSLEKNASKTTDHEDDFNKVPIENRAVIKFLTRKGQNSREIYSEMKKVYKDATPSLPAITFWSVQFRKGRETILNEPKSRTETTAKSPKVAKVKVAANQVRDRIWVKKSELKKSKSTGSLKLSKPSNVSKIKVKRPPINKLKSVSSDKVGVKRIESDTKKKLITIKLPALKKLKAEIK